MLVRYYSSGGKISEKANDSSNVEYIGSNRNISACMLPNSEMLLGTQHANVKKKMENLDLDTNNQGSLKSSNLE